MAKKKFNTGDIWKCKIHFTNDAGQKEITEQYYTLLQETNECPECTWRDMMGAKNAKNKKSWMAIWAGEGKVIHLCVKEMRDHRKWDSSDNTWGYFYWEKHT